MAFDVAGELYDRFMGRYSRLLAPAFADSAGVRAGQRALDVGCGPGALTGELVARLGAEAVAAVDPSERFVAAARERHPGVEVAVAAAERLPFADGAFDVTLAQLVVAFMDDPVAGLSEMRRVTRPDGVVAACMWDHGGGRGPLSPFWRAAREADPHASVESDRPGSRAGDLERLLRDAGLADVEGGELCVRLEHPSFEEWWEPYTLGVGPAGGYVATLDDAVRDRIRERCRAELPPAPFTIDAWAWTATGRA